jgi:hypothetical protein
VAAAGLVRAFDPPTVRRPAFEEVDPPASIRAATDRHPHWYDVDATLDPSEIRRALAAIDVPDGATTALLTPGSRGSRPLPDKAARSPVDGCFLYWGFCASCSRNSGLVFDVDLQPVNILIGEGFVLTARHFGNRFVVGSIEREPEHAALKGEPVQIDVLTTAAETHWLAADKPGRDVLFFSVLQACVTTLFRVRAELGMKKVAYDNVYFRGVLDARKTAAAAELTVDDVNSRAQLDGALTEEARRRLLSIQNVAAEMRRWFDDLKPPGRGDVGIWLPDTQREEDAQHLVDRIYQVRNDLQRVRTETNESMALLMSADTGGQLLAVRALLDRTEAARSAAVVAGAITVILAAVALAATLAAIPSERTRFAPVGTAAGLAGLVILASVFVSAAVAFLVKSPSPGGRAKGCLRTIGVIAAGLGTTAFALAYANTLHPQALWVWTGAGLALSALLLFAYTGDFGQSRRAAQRSRSLSEPAD